MIFREKIIFAPKETVHIRVDYISFSKGCYFIMIVIYPAVFNVIMDFIIPKIVVFANPMDKSLEIYKGIRLNIIHKFAEIVYFLINTFKMVIVLTVATITLFEPLL